MPDELLIALRRVFGDENVVPEFSVASEATDGFDKELYYAPEPDYAVRPFNLDRNFEENNRHIDNALVRFSSLVNTWSERGFRSQLDLSYNPNPRVFIAVEKEFRNSMKHRLGSIINASLLGKVGVVACDDDKVFRAIIRIKGFLDFIRERKGQRLWLGRNVIVIRTGELIASSDRYTP